MIVTHKFRTEPYGNEGKARLLVDIIVDGINVGYLKIASGHVEDLQKCIDGQMKFGSELDQATVQRFPDTHR